MADVSLQQPCLFDHPVPLPRLNPVAQERQRLNAAAKRVLQRLKEGPALNVELCRPEIGGNRGIGRLDECRRDGWLITKEHVHGGQWRYTLHGYK